MHFDLFGVVREGFVFDHCLLTVIFLFLCGGISFIGLAIAFSYLCERGAHCCFEASY